LQTLGNLVYKSIKYGQELGMAAFCIGAMLFYYLLYKSEIVLRALSLWGLLTVIPCLVMLFRFWYIFPMFPLNFSLVHGF
jgi:hypothetical protein